MCMLQQVYGKPGAQAQMAVNDSHELRVGESASESLERLQFKKQEHRKQRCVTVLQTTSHSQEQFRGQQAIKNLHIIRHLFVPGRRGNAEAWMARWGASRRRDEQKQEGEVEE